jgi:single-strand DNA-binding protein
MEVTGTLKTKFDTQKVSDRFQKREFVLTTEANTPYPQHVSFQVTQDKCNMLDQFNPGEELRVQFNLRGREWNGPQGIKYFNTLEAWRIERLQGSNNAGQTTQSQNTNQGGSNNINTSTTPVFTGNPDDNDDLPF